MPSQWCTAVVLCNAAFILIFFLFFTTKETLHFFRLIMLLLPPSAGLFFVGIHKLSVRIRFFLCSTWLIVHKKLCAFFCPCSHCEFVNYNTLGKYVRKEKREWNRFWLLFFCCAAFVRSVGVDSIVLSAAAVSRSKKSEFYIFGVQCACLGSCLSSPYSLPTHTLVGTTTIFDYKRTQTHTRRHSPDCHNV